VPYFLDGNNLVGLARNRSRPEAEDRSALVAELCDRLRRTRARAVLFFDGEVAGAGTALGDLLIRCSGRETADELILREISRSRVPREIVLVTADRDLARRAGDAGAKTLAPRAFWARFGTGRRAPAEDSERVDAEEWIRFFEDDRNRL
jgi:YacP-like NYN domain-containing protein